MGRVKVDAQRSEKPGVFVLDSGAILQGLNLEASRCVTTPAVLAEISTGGATGRRREYLEAAGLAVRDPTAQALEKARQAAQANRVASRLSDTDLGVLALALETRGTLVTDDYTVQDLAQRLGVEWRTASTRGITRAGSWTARCAGCGRAYAADAIDRPCPVCGAEIRLKRR